MHPKPIFSGPVAAVPALASSPPLWDFYRDGVSYTKLSAWLSCPHRFWLWYIAGLKEVEEFDHKREYGNLFDVARSAQVATGSVRYALDAVQEYGLKLRQKFPTAPAGGNGSPEFCTELFCRQYVVYDAYWRLMEENQDYVTMSDMKQASFQVIYRLPDGRQVPIIGQFDEVYRQKNQPQSVVLREDKCKGNPDEHGIQRGITFEGQTGLYCVALELLGYQVEGVLYNLLKRPQGNLHALKRKVGRLNKKTGVRIGEETEEAFLERIIALVREKSSEYFTRWPLRYDQAAQERYKRSFLNPVLTLMANWWDGFDGVPETPESNPLHWQKPFGFFDVFSNGWRGPYWELLTTGSTVGLQQIGGR